MRSTNDKNHNRDQVSKLVAQAKGKSNFLFLPECCDFVGTSVDETKSLSEPLSGETVKFYKEVCKQNQLWASDYQLCDSDIPDI